MNRVKKIFDMLKVRENLEEELRELHRQRIRTQVKQFLEESGYFKGSKFMVMGYDVAK